MSDSLWADLGRKVVSGAKQLASFAHEVWDGIRTRVKSLWGSIRNLFEISVEEPEEAEVMRRVAVANAIRERFGAHPLETLRGATKRERRLLLGEIAERAAAALGIPPVDVVVKTTDPGIAGGFNFETRRITVSRREAECDPMGEDDALELMDTILHEVYHAFQREAIEDCRRCGVGSDKAATWRYEFANYISASQNPEAYWRQSVEATARDFAHAVATSL